MIFNVLKRIITFEKLMLSLAYKSGDFFIFGLYIHCLIFTENMVIFLIVKGKGYLLTLKRRVNSYVIRLTLSLAHYIMIPSFKG